MYDAIVIGARCAGSPTAMLHRFVLAIPTNDGLTCLIAGRPIEYFQPFAADVETNYRETVAIAPKLAEAITDIEPTEPYIGMDVPNYFRKPSGDG